MDITSPSREQLNDFVLDCGGNFQQSWEWGELQERAGRKVIRILARDEKGEPQVAGSFVKHALPLAKFYWIAPRGPVIRRPETRDRRPHEFLTELLSTDYGLRDAIFVRIEPESPITSRQSLAAAGFRSAPHDHSPRATILVDLSKGEDSLLAEMHQKTRYNIRLAEKKGVTIGDEGRGTRDAAFLDLLQATARRDKFSLHPREYYKEMFKVPFVKLFTARLQGELLAGAMVSFFGDRATYLHGASSGKMRQVMAPHLLHWEIMRQAKAQGIKHYDLGGVMPKAAKSHPWVGLTRFKQGFGGEYVEYAGTWDYMLNPFWYGLYKLGKKIL